MLLAQHDEPAEEESGMVLHIQRLLRYLGLVRMEQSLYDTNCT